MDKDSSKGPAEQALFAGEAWFDPVETGVRVRIRGLIEELVEQELEAALGRGRYGRVGGTGGHRHGHRRRQLTGSFGPVELAVPRARLREADGGTREWRSAVLPRYARRTRQHGADRRRPPGRHQHAPGAAGTGGAVPGRGGQGRGQPGLAQGEDRLGRLGPAWLGGRGCRPGRTQRVQPWTAPSCGSGWTARPPPSRCWWSSACAGTGRRCCWRRAAWAGRARRRGGPCWMTWSHAGCEPRSS